jgi:flagellar biosynthesis protein FlhB
MAEQQEQNRSEAPTPFKLRRAREKGMVARSVELGFLGGLLGLAAFLGIAGDGFAHKLAELTRETLVAGIEAAGQPDQPAALPGRIYPAVLQPLMLLGGTIVAIVLLLEVVQLRGILFTAQPLKPDFSRLNPAKGVKRLFSARLLKETLKTVLKTGVYATATWLLLSDALARYAATASETERLPALMGEAVMRLIFVFALIAFAFVVLDQILVRGEFLKQMRMSRREVTREAKDREGDPRIKSRRKQLHREFVAASSSVGQLAGSDMLVVNPQHFAVALRYDPERMAAPVVATKGRNRFALALKEGAYRRGIPVLAEPALARALYRSCEAGNEIPAERFEAVADLYIQLRRRAAPLPSGRS